METSAGGGFLDEPCTLELLPLSPFLIGTLLAWFAMWLMCPWDVRWLLLFYIAIIKLKACC